MNIWRRVFANKRAKPVKKTGLACAECGVSIRKNDRYKIMTVRHVNCHDTRDVGQLNIPE